MRAVLALLLISGGAAWAYAIASGRWPHTAAPAVPANSSGGTRDILQPPPDGGTGNGGGSQLR